MRLKPPDNLLGLSDVQHGASEAETEQVTPWWPCRQVTFTKAGQLRHVEIGRWSMRSMVVLWGGGRNREEGQ